MTVSRGRQRGRTGAARLALDRALAPGAPALARVQEDPLLGPRRGAAALAAFLGASMLAVHLLSLPPKPASPTAPEASTPAPPAHAPDPRLPPRTEPGPAPLASLGAVPLARAEGDARERRIAACVERALRVRGGAQAKPPLPGRWPALKRAREERRVQRHEARAICERDAPET